MRYRGLCERACSVSFLEEFFSETRSLTKCKLFAHALGVCVNRLAAFLGTATQGTRSAAAVLPRVGFASLPLHRFCRLQLRMYLTVLIRP
jgi:hypothetical protein